MWTTFWDMSSGGYLKEEPYDNIYIEAGEEKAREIFLDKFGHDPDDVACNCCGKNYAVNEDKTLTKATEYHRKCLKVSLEEYLKQSDVLIICKEELCTEK